MTMRPKRSPTAALLTPVGRAAVAVIRVSGSWLAEEERGRTLFQPANQRELRDQPLQRLIYGRWGWSTPEEVVVCRTAEDVIEIQCHGGEAAVRRILSDLGELGVKSVSAAEQRRGETDTLAAELQTALSQALTWRTADLVNEQCQGVLRAACERLANVSWTAAGQDEAAALLDQLLAWANFGVHLTTPWSVVLTGRPNVGKSSLINALLGFRRAIVSEQPGTTRDVVTSVTALEGWPIQLADTAGLRETNEVLEAAGIARARERLATADLRVVLVDIGEPPAPEDFQLLENWPAAVFVAHKCDRPDAWGAALPERALRVSSVAQIGLEELQQQIAAALVPAVPAPGTPVPLTSRQVDCIGELRRAVLGQDELVFRAVVNNLIAG